VSQKNQYLEGLKRGDQKVIALIYEEFKPTVRIWILNNSGSQQDADDVFHNSLISLLTNYSEVKVDFKALLIRICKNKWIDELRKKSKTNQVSLEVISHDNFDSTESEAFENAHLDELRFQLMEDALLELTETCRKLLLMIREGIKIPEIASALNMSNANTVYRRKFACMETWKKKVSLNPLFKAL